MLDKTIVVFATKTHHIYDDPSLGLKTYLTPVIEKRLDQSMYKNVIALVREVNTRIQDSLYKFFFSS